MKPLDRLRAALSRLDPAPRAEPLPSAFVPAFVFLSLLTVWLLVTNKYLPGQDISYHAHCSRVWIDGGKPGGPFAAYEPGHPLEANTLMYSVAQLFSHVSSSFAAFRFVQSYYLLGLPLACLYAARALGRSPWGCLLAFPLSYSEIFAAGYANMMFAAPTFILALVHYRRFVQAPTRGRGVGVAALFALVFLSHAHVYLWLGALVILYSIAVLLQRLYQAANGGTGGGFVGVGLLAVSAAVTALPSLALFARWYARGYGAGHSIGGTGNNRPFMNELEFMPFLQKFQGGALQSFHSTMSPYEVHYLLALGFMVMFALSMARASADRSAPLPELAVLVSAVSYFFLPDSVAQQMVAARQWYFVYWLVPLVITPIPVARGALRSIAVIATIVAYATARMGMLTEHLRHFTKEEMAGFDEIVAAAPREPGLTLAYAAVNARSRYWMTTPMYHSYGFLGAQRSYDGPVEYSDSHSVAPIRYARPPALPIKHLYNNPNWPLDKQIWQYDLVLVYRWSPTPAQESTAREHGTLVASAGEWQLWRSKHQ